MGTIYLTFLTPMDCGFSLWATATDCGWEVKYIDPQPNGEKSSIRGISASERPCRGRQSIREWRLRQRVKIN